MDIYATSSLCDFVNVLGKDIIENLRPKGRFVWEKFLGILSSLKSEISFDINGMPMWSVGIDDIKNPLTTLDEIFTYLSSADKHCFVTIDEFQQITRYQDKKVLRRCCVLIYKDVLMPILFSQAVTVISWERY